MTLSLADLSPVRIGIDVGGTFTKGVAIEARSHALLVEARVPTTHRATEGVAAGVLEVLGELLGRLPESSSIMLVAHATTQATNALLEGDTARVGILALGPSSEERIIRKLTKLTDIHLGSAQRLAPRWAFLPTDKEGLEQAVKGQLAAWQREGIEVVAINQAFGVDDPGLERQVLCWSNEMGLPGTAGSHLSGVYGLELRNSTTAVNASILPTMLRTARHVEAALSRTLPRAPFLIVRGDGGAVDLQGLRETPIQTIVSGPAASLAGAILHHGINDGIFFEVGGTSTNIGAIKGGRPVMKHMTVMDFPTSFRAADIRIAGVAGGSLLRLSKRRIEEVGPRSAHIAGLSYSCFAMPAALEGAALKRISPCPGDPCDYAVLETPAAERYAITPTCAANTLEELDAEDYAAANQESARLALSLLAAELGAELEDTARAVLQASAEKLIRTVAALAKTYGLQRSTLYAGGGAASVLGPVVAKRLGMRFECVPQASVISSIGAALALIRVERERSAKINDPTVADLLIREVEREAVRLGADPSRLHTEVHYLPEERLLRALAVGVHPIDVHAREQSDEALLKRAQGLLGTTAEPFYAGEGHVLFRAEHRVRHVFRQVLRRPVTVLDRHGAELLTLEDATLVCGEPTHVMARLKPYLKGGVTPQLYALTPTRLINCSYLSDPKALVPFLTKIFRLESRVGLIVDSD